MAGTDEKLPELSLDTFGNVVAKCANGGTLKTQTVEGLLMYALLLEMRRLNQKMSGAQTQVRYRV